MNSLESPIGIRDLLPGDLQDRDQIRSQIFQVFEGLGYQKIAVPLFEAEHTFSSTHNHLIDQAFKVIDSDGKLLIIRPDMTLPIARMAATRLAGTERPLKLYYAGSSFRQKVQNSDQKREIYQIGVELIGGQDEEASKEEILKVIQDTLVAIGIKEYYLTATNTAHWTEYAQAEQIKAALNRGDLIKFHELTKGEYLQSGLVQKKGDNFILDYSMPVDYDYYTGLYFEIVVNGKVIGSGGQYNNLMKNYGKDEPAIGFSLIMEGLVKYAG